MINIYKTFINFSAKGIKHQEQRKLMKTIMPSKSIIGGMSIQSIPSLHAILKCN